MKKQEEKKQKVNPSEQALHYLYILSMDGRKMKQNLEQDKAYLLDKMSKLTGDFSIYGKARAAVVLARNSQQNAAYREKAGEYLQSVNEYAVYREEMGRYYDTRKALYSLEKLQDSYPGICDRGAADAEAERQADHRGTAALAPDVETYPGLGYASEHRGCRLRLYEGQ